MDCLILVGISAMRLSSTYMLCGICTGVPSACMSPLRIESGKVGENTTDSDGGGQSYTLSMYSLCLEINDVLEDSLCAKASLALLMSSQLAGLVLLPKVLPHGTKSSCSMMKQKTWVMSGCSLHCLKDPVASLSQRRMSLSG
eukprot:8033925-Ditylum_brightwellii.AAC.1